MNKDEVLRAYKGKRPLELDNEMIDSVTIMDDEHGGISAYLHIRFAGGGCGFGGFRLGYLDGGKGKNLQKAPCYCADFICRCMEVVDTNSWESLKGKPLRCLHEGLGGSIIAIGHYLKDEWYSPKLEWGKE